MGVISETFDTTFTALIAIEEVTHSPSRVLSVALRVQLRRQWH